MLVPAASSSEVPPAASSSSPAPASTNPFAGGGMPPPPKPASPFGDAFAATKALNPYASPAGGAAYNTSTFATADGPITNVVVPLDPIMNHAWRVWQANLGILVGVTLIVMVITYAIVIPLGFLQAVLEREAPEFVPFVALFGNIFSNVVQIFLGIGQASISLKICRGQPATIGDLFGGGPRFLPVLGASLLAGIAFAVGFMLCIVPGILLAIWFWPFYFLVVENKSPVMDSFGLASKVTEGNRGTTVILWLVSVGIIIVGLLAFCVGIILAAPLVSVLWATAYLMMSGQLPPQPQYVKY
jgi:hypothetical protein